MKGTVIPYSEAELAWLRERAAMKRSELHAEFCATFSRDDVSFENLRALMKRKGWHTGRTGRFEKGRHSWKKGQTLPVPEGLVLKCLDGDKQNTDPTNWLAIPRALLPRLNGRWGSLGYDEAEPELKPYILAAARLQHAAREARKSGGAKS